ncbi:dTDP-4-dehydrorhamnose reductase [Isoptericola sp. b515]|uniref:dTDP-4-dehydrorhamnose reductase n=1 Tax=Isoptericola sp. b515 TaxID=3064652 RepID=UPI002712656A|nr:dTDP-4-dehydrorhamnose reductase [Isoptericola sp. b515]MDO8149361.1 dTDP-4-dehydrorhamnose reductase [Isoptericola sp. b515]
MAPVDRAQRWAVLGAGGMLGRDLVDVLTDAGASVRAFTHADLDITEADATRRALAGADVVVNAAAWTDVDAAETHESEAMAVNAVGAAHVARAARLAGARLVHLSTDYVFDGHHAAPYPEDAPTAPESIYGRSKAAGERAVRDEAFDHLIVRTAWLYGAHGRCFPRTIARLAAERDRLAVVHDQVGQPTWSRDLAELIVRLVSARAPAGTYHGTASGRTSWFGFARQILTTTGSTAQLDRVPSEALPRPARRPRFSVLAHDALRRAGVQPIGDWADRWDVAAPSVLAGIAAVPGAPEAGYPSSSVSR